MHRAGLHRPRPRLVATLLIVEGAVMSWQGVSWPVPYIPLAIITATPAPGGAN